MQRALVRAQTIIIFLKNFLTHNLLYELAKGLGLIKKPQFPSGNLPTAGVEPTTTYNGPLYKPNICAA